MEFDNPDQLRNVLLEAILNSIMEMRRDLERRIGVVLYKKLPQATVVNMAQSISKDINAFIEGELVNSGVLNKAMDRLL